MGLTIDDDLFLRGGVFSRILQTSLNHGVWRGRYENLKSKIGGDALRVTNYPTVRLAMKLQGDFKGQARH
jgi:hypothetical protein